MVVKFVKALSALVALLGLLVGVPFLLVTLAGNPIPPGGLDEIALMTDHTILGLLAVIGWVFWAQIATCVFAEIPAALSGRAATRVPVATGGQQRLARLLVTSVVAIGVGATTFTGATAQAGAAPPSSPAPQHTPALTAAPVAQAVTQREEALLVVKVAVGDTLWGLAERHLGAGERWQDIADLNRSRDVADGVRFTDGNNIRPGWTLRLPGDATAVPTTPASVSVSVVRGDSLAQIAKDSLGDVNAWPRIYAANEDIIGSDPNLIIPGQVLSIPGEHSPRPKVEPGPTSASRPDTDDAPTPAPAPEAAPAPPTDAAPAPVQDQSEAARSANQEVASEADGFSAVRAALASGGFLAVGVLGALIANRRRQFRNRRSGRTIAATPAELVQTERDVVEAGTAAGREVDFVRAALQRLADNLRGAGNELPALGAAVVSEAELRLHFTAPALSAAPTLWEATSDAMSWSLRRGFAPDWKAADLPDPYPALVSVGTDTNGATWLLDLEAQGVVSVAGDPEAASDVMRFLGAELALNPWAKGVELLVTGDFGDELVGLNVSRVRHVDDFEVAAAIGVRAADNAEEVARVQGRKLLDARRDGLGVESTHPVVVVMTGSAPDDLASATQTNRGGRSRVVVLNDDPAAPVIELTGDGMALLPRWGAAVRVNQLTAPAILDMAALLKSAESAADEPMPTLGEDTALNQWADAAGAVRLERTTPRQAVLSSVAESDGVSVEESSTVAFAPVEGDPGSLLPSPDAVYLDRAATTREDLAALAPSVPAAARAEVEALDPSLDAGVAAWHDADSPRPKVRLLGPVHLEAHGERRFEVGNRIAVVTELVAFLVSQPRGATPEATACGLAMKPSTLQNRVSDARKILGDNESGDPWFPEAALSPTGRERGIATYELSEGVLVDADLFRRLRVRGQARGADGVADLAAALGLVTGAPFGQLRPGGYGWLSETPFDHFLVAAIVDVAHVVTTSALAKDDLALARRACEIAIKAAPYEDKPRLDLAAVVEAEGGGSADEVVADQVANRSDDDGPEDLSERSAAILQQRGWLAS